MQLDVFVTETLKDIIKGVANAKEFAKENKAQVNPSKTATPPFYLVSEDWQGVKGISKIDFDVAVSASSEKEAGVTGGISVLALNIGGKDSGKNINETISRIKFSVDLVLP